MSRKSSEVRKTLLRNTEQPLKPLNVRKSENFVRKEAEKPEKSSGVRSAVQSRRSAPAQIPQKTSESGNRFKKPELNTALVMRQRMEATAKEKAEKINVDPAVVASSKEEVYKKLNFNRFTRVYKNLVPVNVNDVSLAEEKKLSRKKDPAKKPRDPVPNLEDFMKPIPPLNVPLHFNTEPIKIRPIKPELKEVNQQLHMQNLKMMKHFGVL
ncbi:uncharacterized protein LOC129791064 [Lutzomyia longipalpis]|uniref:uncharacterized protein LOC129791064 n=1 Tax=Lutzomyia longipalpis TaxID=7200 RepID=UPI0024833EA4|nr:uncharacterized protein LOC129791064 [Lutzomyia longipalpis]